MLNYLQKEYNPDEIVLEVWDLERIQDRFSKNKIYLQPWIEDKIDFVENKVISKRFKQILSFFWINKYKKYFKVFWWGEVLDESRKFPHDGRNLVLLYNHSIRKWNFILVGWIWTNEKSLTKRLFKYILPRAKKTICREKTTYNRVNNYWKNNAVLYDDFSKEIFESNQKSKEEKNLLINISPKYFNKENLKNIKNFVEKHSSDRKKIFFPADINIDKVLFTDIRKIIPNLEIYDRTKHTLQDTIDLFSTCVAWIWSRLHFLYPLKLFGKEFENISNSDKVKKVLFDRWN